jgi:hypothetical protein
MAAQLTTSQGKSAWDRKVHPGVHKLHSFRVGEKSGIKKVTSSQLGP